MRLLLAIILLAFPFAEIFLLVKLAHIYGWLLLLYLVVVGFLGLQLFRGEKLLISAKMVQSISAGGNPIKTIMGSARNMFAGVLLIIPGVITDIIAVILLLIPINKDNLNIAPNQQQQQDNTPPFEKSRRKPSSKAANDDVIEGEFTHVKDETE